MGQALQATRLVRGARRVAPRAAPPPALDAPQRLALFLCALHPPSALQLLEGLAPCVRDRARACAAELNALDSAARQAVITSTFGRREGAVERLRALLLEASPPLRRAIAGVVPAPYRGLVAHLTLTAQVPPALRALATRLVREALRASG